MAKLTKSQLASYGKRIMTEAKKLRKKSPNVKWTKLVSAAAKSVKNNKGK